MTRDSEMGIFEDYGDESMEVIMAAAIENDTVQQVSALRDILDSEAIIHLQWLVQYFSDRGHTATACEIENYQRMIEWSMTPADELPEQEAVAG